jgi:hypothetical protein
VDPKAIKVLLVQKARKVQQVLRLEFLDQLVQQVFEVQQAHLVPQVLQGLRVAVVVQVPQV